MAKSKSKLKSDWDAAWPLTVLSCLKTIQCGWIKTILQKEPKFLHSDVNDSLPVIANAWLQLLLQRVAQPVFRTSWSYPPYFSHKNGHGHLLTLWVYWSHLLLAIISSTKPLVLLLDTANWCVLPYHFVINGFFYFIYFFTHNTT